MIRTPLVGLAAIALFACDPSFGPEAQDNTDYFPLDGSTRVTSYRAADALMDWTLELHTTNQRVVDDVELVDLSFYDATNAETLYTVTWSSDTVHGVRIHGYSDVAAEQQVEFAEPVMLVERGVQGAPVVTETGGVTFTASAGSYDGCETFWNPDWADERCLVVTLSDADDDPETHGLITGEYRLVPSYGAAWLDLDLFDDIWWMSDFDWEE